MSDRSAAADYDINKHHHSAEKAAADDGPDRPLGFKHVINFFDKPVTWFKEKIVEPNQKKYPWYHMQFRRVPTIEQCFVDDEVCIYEANEQFLRDRYVDTEILNILRYRMDDCVRQEYPDYEKCFPLKEVYETAATNWFIKYGELGPNYEVRRCFMKQKHRMLWERRHGKVGSGMKKNENEISAEPDGH